jgi:DASS family divalent anion:Na+ symporter
VLAGMIPSNGARSGGVILPIALSISEIYGSKPGATAGLLGSFLMIAVYQSICITTAMFLTGQASNPLAARFAEAAGYHHITWLNWLEATIVPGAVSLMIVPWLVMKLHPPEIKRTPEAPAFAKSELVKMGRMSRHERIVAAIFALVCGLWVSSSWSGIDITQTALIGAVLLLVTGTLTWDDVKSEREAWSVFIWYAGLLRLGQALGDAGVTKAFADSVAKQFGHYGWEVLLGVGLMVYFYAHYAFASITAHVVSMFPPFLAVLLMQGGPPGIIVYTFAILANLAAGLTHFGTTPGPIFFAHGYTTLRVWWKVGLIISFVNLAIWTTIGFAWWKVIGVW